jgi:hypothetical protein
LSSLVLNERARDRTVGKTIAAAGAFLFDNFKPMMDVLHLRMHRSFGTNFAAEAARDAESLVNSCFHEGLL